MIFGCYCVIILKYLTAAGVSFSFMSDFVLGFVFYPCFGKGFSALNASAAFATVYFFAFVAAPSFRIVYSECFADSGNVRL